MPRITGKPVTIYRRGERGPFASSSSDPYVQGYKAEDPDYSMCPRCKRYYKNPENKHYTDFKNKIRCLREKFDG